MLEVVREVIKKVPTKSTNSAKFANSAKYVKFINNVKCRERWSKGPPRNLQIL